MLPKLAILAGGGDVPGRVIQACENDNRPYFVIAFEGHTPQETVQDVNHAWVRLGAAGTTLNILKQENIEELVLVGDIRRPTLKQLRPDWWAVKFLTQTNAFNRGDDGLLRLLVSALENQEGFRIRGAHELVPELLAKQGLIAGTMNDDFSDHDADISLAMTAALELGAKDTGQAAIARNGKVVECEDEKGTDAMIERFINSQNTDCPVRSGVLAKMAKPNQEIRVDLPTIGPDTVEKAAQAQLAGIVIEADRSQIVDREKVREIADRTGVFVLVVPQTEDNSDGA